MQIVPSQPGNGCQRIHWPPFPAPEKAFWRDRAFLRTCVKRAPQSRDAGCVPFAARQQMSKKEPIGCKKWRAAGKARAFDAAEIVARFSVRSGYLAGRGAACPLGLVEPGIGVLQKVFQSVSAIVADHGADAG